MLENPIPHQSAVALRSGEKLSIKSSHPYLVVNPYKNLYPYAVATVRRNGTIKLIPRVRKTCLEILFVTTPAKIVVAYMNKMIMADCHIQRTIHNAENQFIAKATPVSARIGIVIINKIMPTMIIGIMTSITPESTLLLNNFALVYGIT